MKKYKSEIKRTSTLLLLFFFVQQILWSMPTNPKEELNIENSPVDASKDCSNWVEVYNLEQYNFQFDGFSEPDALEYFWDFGDGSFATGSSVVHSFFPGPGDIFLVSLTTIHPADTGFDTCFATSYHTINLLGNNDDCLVSFDWIESDSLTIDFFNVMTFPNPEAFNFFWDFGDGEVGTGEYFETHSYDNPGIYTVCLFVDTYDSSLNLCTAELCLDIEVLGFNLDCFNWFDAMTDDGQTFTFTGISEPEAVSYTWDFGDGFTGTGEIVMHTYDDNISGWIPVTLSTLTMEPAGGDSCYAFSEQIIYVNGSGDCTANFEIIPDTSDFLSYQFNNTSIGLINFFWWEFGDGEISLEENPSHTFLVPGEYEVCLTIMSDSLGIFCTDMICHDVIIDYTLEANYTYSLDTLSGIPNQYYFTDLTVGQADEWYWDFGDGNSSTEQNPLYQFAANSDPLVCLSAYRTFAGSTTYSDTHCEDIPTYSYFNLGGQVFLDNIPMNNLSGDTTVVDTAWAFLYRKYGNTLIPTDTNYFYQYGYYWFTQVRQGDYVVKISLTPNSLNYHNYVSSYNPSALFWANAGTIDLNSSDNYTAEVALKPFEESGTGPGSISGLINIINSEGIDNSQIPAAEVILMTQDFQVLDFICTDSLGAFTFNNLSLGTYVLYCEATGWFTQAVTVVLDESQPSVTDLQLNISEQTTSIAIIENQGLHLSPVFPNPVREKLFLAIQSDYSMEIIVSISDIVGNQYKTSRHSLNRGDNQIERDVRFLPAGVFIISFTNADGNIHLFQKFVK